MGRPATVSQYRVELPWVDMKLSGNGRLHWAEKSRRVKRRRFEASLLARSAGVKRVQGDVRVTCLFTFHAPTKANRDRDNLIASLKADQDGIADACGVDDGRWQVDHAIGEPVRNGCVVADITIVVADITIEVVK